MQRSVRTMLWGVTLVALGSLYLSYRNLLRSVEFAAAQSGLVEGRAELSEIDLLETVTRQVEGHTICAFGDAAAWPIQGMLRHFRPLVEQRIADYQKRTALPAAAASQSGWFA